MACDEADIATIHESYRQGKLDYLIGAGVSIDAGLPSWSVLNNRLLEFFFAHEYSEQTKGGGKLPLEPEPDELSAMASIFVRRFNREPVVDLVRNNVSDDFAALLRKALYGTHGDVVLQALQYELAAALQPEEESLKWTPWRLLRGPPAMHSSQEVLSKRCIVPHKLTAISPVK